MKPGIGTGDGGYDINMGGSSVNGQLDIRQLDIGNQTFSNLTFGNRYFGKWTFGNCNFGNWTICNVYSGNLCKLAINYKQGYNILHLLKLFIKTYK